jgi:adenylate kinase
LKNLRRKRSAPGSAGEERAVNETKKRYKGILLLGPTGSGKTPLGETLATRGIAGQRCVHFDFGAHLRRAARNPEAYPLLEKADIRVIQGCLAHGALLEDSQFSIIEALFKSFAQTGAVNKDDVIVLNGMPRHVEQALKIADFIDVVSAVRLLCDDKTVRERIRTDAGGDRASRTDDSADAVAKKCEIFKKRTLPLLSFYRGRIGNNILEVPVTVNTSPEETVEMIVDFVQKRRGLRQM